MFQLKALELDTLQSHHAFHASLVKKASSTQAKETWWFAMGI